MKPIFDIFSKTKKPSGKEKEKPKIIIDYREKNSLVVSELVKFGFETEIKELKVADYILKDVAIERKTVSDFISSMLNHRLLNQIEELQQYKNKLLIIEGIDEQDLYNDKNEGVNGNAIRGFLLSITLKHKIPMIFTKDSEDTAKFLLVLSKKREKEVSLNAKKKSFNKKEQLQFIIEGFPGIGPKTSKKLLKEFGTIRNIINASEEELTKILGKKTEIFKKIVENKY
ncbi:MAG: ERCC4 domain-containing protein [Nanoarchaeota archaeon]|nr:ERCC4 domain-containing protein [Nanoarchaeota archaeon]